MPDPEPKLLDKRQVAAKLTVSEGTIDNLIARGQFPQPLKIGASVRWLEADLDEYLRWKDWERKLTRSVIPDFGEQPNEAQIDPTAPNGAQPDPNSPKAGKRPKT